MEDTEIFNLTIVSSSLPDSFHPAEPYQTAITIVDDDDRKLLCVISLLHACVDVSETPSIKTHNSDAAKKASMPHCG